ncbi:MAG: molybdenum cofactor guanylyltransferase [Candidatus Poseidoniales archaeon]|nr:molybdenum cofactor guanylyltransferase [Candidatus Poseidoniales archaeon]
MRSLLLAGGKSARMGQDKALIEVDGLPMITRVIKALASAGKEPIRIAVSSPEKMEDYAAVIDPKYDIEWVLDSIPHAGPVDAIIENLNDPFCLQEESIQLATVDVPWINEEVFTSLEKSMAKNDMAIIPTDGQILHPLIALVRPKILKERLRNWNAESLKEVLLKGPHTLLMVNRTLIKNINSPKDL